MTTIRTRVERRLAPRHTAYVVLGGVVGALAAPVVWTLAGLATADLLNALFLRKSRSRDKRTTYESGETPIGGAWVQFPLAFYVFALLFVAFDIEVIFIYLWAIVFKDPNLNPAGLFISMVVFVLILLLGLAYAWRKGALTWR